MLCKSKSLDHIQKRRCPLFGGVTTRQHAACGFCYMSWVLLCSIAKMLTTAHIQNFRQKVSGRKHSENKYVFKTEETGRHCNSISKHRRQHKTLWLTARAVRKRWQEQLGIRDGSSCKNWIWIKTSGTPGLVWSCSHMCLWFWLETIFS